MGNQIMNLKQDPYILALRRYWSIPAILALLTLVFSVVLERQAEPLYEAQATYVISPAPNTLEEDLNDVIYAIDKINVEVVSTYVEILGSQRMLEQASDSLELSSSELNAYKTRAVRLPSSSILSVWVSGPEPEQAADIANRIGVETAQHVMLLYGIYSLTPLDSAAGAPKIPGANPIEAALLAGLTGAIAGLLLVSGATHIRILRGQA